VDGALDRSVAATAGDGREAVLAMRQPAVLDGLDAAVAEPAGSVV
jgi:hypothetical protein